jgi:predicted nucleic acid-binding protein
MIVSDASPLISLAKAGKLYLLREIFERVLIEEEVKRETIDRGKVEGAPDALVIEDAVKEGWIEIEKIKEGKRFRGCKMIAFTKLPFASQREKFL